jgi:hypothetical protein
MKRIPITTLSWFSFSQDSNWRKIGRTWLNGKVFSTKKITDVPFTGEEQKEFENREKDDPQVSYHDNGQLFTKITYKNV